MQAVGKEAYGRDHVAVAVQVPSNCSQKLPICKQTYRPRDLNDAMPIKGVMRLPLPLFFNGTSNISTAVLQTDLAELAFFNIQDPFVPYTSVEDMVKDAMPRQRLGNVLAAIEFYNATDDRWTTSNTLSYAIRMNPVKTPSTRQWAKPISSEYAAGTWWLYYYSGFAVLQVFRQKRAYSSKIISIDDCVANIVT